MKIPNLLFVKKGRPVLQESEKRSHRLSLRVSEKEKEIITFMAKKHKKDVSEYLRWLVDQDVKRNRLVRSLNNDSEEKR